MRKVLLILLATCLPLGVFAKQEMINFGDLDEAQISELKLLIAQAKKTDSNSFLSAGEIKDYASVGEAVGKAIGSVCKELNVGVNEFIATPAGMITVGFISWKIMGDEAAKFIGEAVQLFFVLLMAIFIIPLWIYLYRRSIIKSIDISIDENNKKIKKVNFYDKHSRGDLPCFLIVIGLGLLIAGAMIAL